MSNSVRGSVSVVGLEQRFTRQNFLVGNIVMWTDHGHILDLGVGRLALVGHGRVEAVVVRHVTNGLHPAVR